MHMSVHDTISSYDNVRKHLLPQQDSENTSRHGRQESISQIFCGDRMPLIPQRLQCSDLCPLLLHHTGHCSKADQSRHKEKQDREHFPDRTHPVRIVTVTCVLCQITPVIDIPFRTINILNFFLRICKFLLRVRYLLFAVCDLLLSLAFTVIILCPSVREFLLGRGKFRFCFRDPALARLDLIPSRIDLSLP